MGLDGSFFEFPLLKLSNHSIEFSIDLSKIKEK